MRSSVRLPNESDCEFQERAERMAVYARVLIDAALANQFVQRYIADENLPQWTEASQLRSPIVRVEFEQAIAIGSIGETLRATKSKNWGEGPQILPVEPDDPLYEQRITYLFRENSIYNRRFQQRQKLKQLLGNKNRKLVGVATRSNLTEFVDALTMEQAFLIRKGLGISPDTFWRAAKGTDFVELPDKATYISDVLICQLPKKARQIQLEFEVG